MAGDTRDLAKPHLQSPSTGATASPDLGKTPKVYETFNASPQSSANALPEGYGQNTAGSRKPELPSLSDAVKSVRFEDFNQFYMYPCVRESLLTGIGGAFFVGGGRMIFGTPLFRACNWAVGTFCLLGVGSYEYCLQKKRIEKANMKRVVEVLDRKRAEKEAEDRAAKVAMEAKRSAEEEAERAKKSSWRFW